MNLDGRPQKFERTPVRYRAPKPATKCPVGVKGSPPATSASWLLFAQSQKSPRTHDTAPSCRTDLQGVSYGSTTTMFQQASLGDTPHDLVHRCVPWHDLAVAPDGSPSLW